MFCNPAGLQLVYDTSQTTAYINYNYGYIYFSHHIAGLCMKTELFSHYRKQFYEEKARTRDTTQRSPHGFCGDYQTNPSPRLSTIVILSQLR